MSERMGHSLVLFADNCDTPSGCPVGSHYMSIYDGLFATHGLEPWRPYPYFCSVQGLLMDGRQADAWNTLLYEPAVLAKLCEKGSQLHFETVVDPNDRRYLY